MERRAVVAALGTLPAATAGCLGDLQEEPESSPTGGNTGTTTDADSVVGAFEGDASRPECKRSSETVEIDVGDEPRTFETATTVPYPDPLTEFARDAVVDYVEAFEHAYVTKDVLCGRHRSGHVFRVDYSVLERETFDWYDDVSVVFLRRIGAATSGSDGNGNLWEADVASAGVVYAVDESGVARVDFDDVNAVDQTDLESHAPDPLDGGELVATFQ